MKTMIRNFRLTVTAFSLALTTVTAVAMGYDTPVTYAQLPQTAQEFIKTHFSDVKMLYALKDRDFLSSSYEVRFDNGTKVEFTGKGQWKEVDTKFGVPEAIIPSAIKNYIGEHYPEAHVMDIDRDRTGYEVKLSIGIEIKFDNKFRVRGYDD